jgi:hypothetical protein
MSPTSILPADNRLASFSLCICSETLGILTSARVSNVTMQVLLCRHHTRPPHDRRLWLWRDLLSLSPSQPDIARNTVRALYGVALACKVHSEIREPGADGAPTKIGAPKSTIGAASQLNLRGTSFDRSWLFSNGDRVLV